MLAKAFAKCLASIDQKEESIAYQSPWKGEFVNGVDKASKATVGELKDGVLVTKKSWKGPYERTLQLEEKSITTLEPETGRVTNRWTLPDVIAVTHEGQELTLKLAASACLTCGLLGDSLTIDCSSEARAAALRDGIALACHEYYMETQS